MRTESRSDCAPSIYGNPSGLLPCAIQLHGFTRMSRLVEALKSTITSATGIEPSQVRFNSLADAAPPSILYREIDSGGPDFLDPGLKLFTLNFELRRGPSVRRVRAI